MLRQPLRVMSLAGDGDVCESDASSGVDGASQQSGFESSFGGAARAVLRQQLRALKRMKVKPNKMADQLTYAYEFKKHVAMASSEGANSTSDRNAWFKRWMAVFRGALPPFLRSSVVGFATFSAYDTNRHLYRRYLQPSSSSGESDTMFAAANGLACGFVGGLLQLLLEGRAISLHTSPGLVQYRRSTMSTSMITFSVLFGTYEATKHALSCRSRGTWTRADDTRYYLVVAGAGGAAGLASETAAAVWAERSQPVRTLVRLWRTPSFLVSAVVPSLLGFVAYEFEEE